ncbi:hypothetical protein OC835_006159 [Tilletia horrida]|nr:hypothetical protein OC835_006159 [Tilletia horrida]
MLANLHAYAHTLDDALRFPVLRDEFERRAHEQEQAHEQRRLFRLEPLPALSTDRFHVSALPEPDSRLRTLYLGGPHRKDGAQPVKDASPSPPRSPPARAGEQQLSTEDDQPLGAATALTQILDLVASQTPTALFEWNTVALRFQWRPLPPPSKRQRRNPNAPAAHQIAELSAETTLSTSRPFLKVATLLRRSATVLDALVSAGPANAELPREAHALIFAVRQVLDWLRRELIVWQERHGEQQQTLLRTDSADRAGAAAASNSIDDNTRALLILSEAAYGLRTCELILNAISELLNCPFHRQPPFRPLPGLNLVPPSAPAGRDAGKLDQSSNPGALLSHIYAHASATFSTASSPLVRGVMSWILEHTTQAWRQDVSKWIGWPIGTTQSSSASSTTSSLRPPIALVMAAGEKKTVQEPWSGAQVEQERDERGELDTGYVLRPARIPSFVSLSTARQLLEAGRALHLLHTATDGQHPIFQQSVSLANRKYAISPPAIPTWTFDSKAKAEQLRALDHTLLASKSAASRWVYFGKRKRVADAGASVLSGRTSKPGGVTSWVADAQMHQHGHGSARQSIAGLSLHGTQGSGARPRHSSLRIFPSRTLDSLPPLPMDASQKVQNAKRVEQAEGKRDGNELEDAELDIEDRLEKALRLFDALPGMHIADEKPGDSVKHVAKQSAVRSNRQSAAVPLLAYLAAFCEAAANERPSEDIPRSFVLASSYADEADNLPEAEVDPFTHSSTSFDLDAATRQTLLQPWLAWSRTVNAALVSVFFRDLAVDLYLATCQRFLLLGSEAFRTRLVGVLFDDSVEGRGGVDEDRFRAKSKGGKVKQAGGVGLSVRLTSSSSWPPAGSELSVSLNLAVAETLAESKASHARLMASSRPLLSLSSLHAAEAALHDLDQRLSFSVIDMQADKPKSIHGLDWLTLTFTPPPLISPLLQAHASACYQRLFNFLLRILRVQTVLRGLAKRAFLQSRAAIRASASFKERTAKAPPSPSAAQLPHNSVAALLFTHDPLLRAALNSFRYEAQHVVNALATYVADFAIGLPWTRFQKRLRQLARGAAAGSGGAAGKGLSTVGGGAATVKAGDGADDDDGSSVWTRVGSGGGLQDENGEDEDGDGDADQDGEGEEDEDEDAASNEETFQLFNVFSLSRYHERVLDRMLQACFLKQRFRGIMKIINDLFQLILDLGQLLQDIDTTPGSCTTGDAGKDPSDAGAEAQAAAYPARERFYTLHARWKSRYALLAQSLRLVHLHSRSNASHQPQQQQQQQQQQGEAAAAVKTQFEQALAAALDLDTSSAAVPAAGQKDGGGGAAAAASSHHPAELEMRRLEAEEELDLRALEDGEGGGGGGGGRREAVVSGAGVLLSLLGLPTS